MIRKIWNVVGNSDYISHNKFTKDMIKIVNDSNAVY